MNTLQLLGLSVLCVLIWNLFDYIIHQSTYKYQNINSIRATNMSNPQPIVFLSHGGGPSFFLDAKERPSFKGMDKHSAAADFLRNFTKTVKLNKPEVILVISAHWEEDVPTVNTNSKHSLYYDYYNFPPDTYKLEWPVKGSPETSRDAAALLSAKGVTCREDSRRGLDHGVFVPLKLAFPKADIPVSQISLLKNNDVGQHLVIGEVLGQLSQRGVLIIGSGFATHRGGTTGAPTPDWATQFQAWLHDVLLNTNYTAEDRKQRLLSCMDTAPNMDKAHPGIEHFLPLIMCSAAAGYVPGQLLHSEFVMQTLLNEHYLFQPR